jgi:hypothetical protein
VPEAPKERKIQTMYFYAVMRWVDPADPDLEPVEVATPPAADRTSSAADKKGGKAAKAAEPPGKE